MRSQLRDVLVRAGKFEWVARSNPTISRPMLLKEACATHIDKEPSNNGDVMVRLGDDIVVDSEMIRSLKPFDSWLRSEMRSNHAGETGAVYIYVGCQRALDFRKRWFPSSKRSPHKEYEDEMLAFARQHEQSERTHLVLINQILDDRSFQGDRSILLPMWKFAGFSLGFLSTAWCPRGMYLTTDAVESFVEEHYNSQIRRLEQEIREKPGGCQSREALKSLLEYCCEDEVHHRDEAREKAGEGPFPWKGFHWVDGAWRGLVFGASYAGAAIAKRV